MRCLMAWSPASPPASFYFFCFCFPCFLLLVHTPHSHSCVTCVQDICGPLVSTSFCAFGSYSSVHRKLNIHTYRRTHSGDFVTYNSFPRRSIYQYLFGSRSRPSCIGALPASLWDTEELSDSYLIAVLHPVSWLLTSKFKSMCQ
ncbi:hypothetical protein DFH08DRAFT_346767 [Mycena albidolilacea]|uniref:Secreted protein n=1 Tax=Mycena albidolilacea TaxID=1033008 RepID=A0AAD7EGX7_9AGAR|nr:hypothetical protein DFH08DRAFT_346767 [Mycena albidolilacea]